MKKTVLALAMIGAASSVSAHNIGYWKNSAGEYVKNSAGECVKTGLWNESLAVPECDANAKPQAVAEVVEEAPKAAPVLETVKAEAPKVEAAAEPVVEAAKGPSYKSISLASGAAFATGSSNLNAAGKSELSTLAADLKGLDVLNKVTIEGHTDSSGSESFNQRLSQQRADAVKAYLVDEGIAADKIEAIGYGESQPIADNSTSAGKAQNRRVEIKVDGSKTVQQ
jgi:OOP family OmpA-OmpF porin